MQTISIIIPVYNVEKYLRECLDSVLVSNKFTGQVVCVNDGSTDGSGKILEEYASNYPNVEVYNQANQGQSVARNEGLKHAKGDYVLYLDSDDYYYDHAIGYLQGLAEKHTDVDFFYIDCIETNGKRFYTLPYAEPVKMSLKEYYDYEYAQVGTTPIGGVWSGMYKREFLEKNHLQMLPGCRYEDELFVMEVFLQEGSCMALHIDKPYYYYRIGREGATTAKDTLTHYFDRRKIVHGCYHVIKENSLMTEARKHKVFTLCEENVLRAYLNGYKKDILKFFGKEDLQIMKACAINERDRKLCRLANLSPRLMAAYRTENLLPFVRRMINKFL